MCRCPAEPTLREAFAEDIVQAIMKADHVDPNGSARSSEA